MVLREQVVFPTWNVIISGSRAGTNRDTRVVNWKTFSFSLPRCGIKIVLFSIVIFSSAI